MTLKKKELFLLIFLILLQSCSGGRIGNFLESSFNNLEKTSKNEDLQNNLVNKKTVETKEINDKKNIKTLETKEINDKKNKKTVETKEIDDKKNKKIKIIEKPENYIENINDINSDKILKQKNNKIKKSIKKRNINLQSYKIIFILKDVDPKDPTEELSSILSNSKVNFEIEKIERILDTQNKGMNKN